MNGGEHGRGHRHDRLLGPAPCSQAVGLVFRSSHDCTDALFIGYYLAYYIYPGYYGAAYYGYSPRYYGTGVWLSGKHAHKRKAAQRVR